MSKLKIIGGFFRTNMIQTIRFNLKMLPLKQALRMPVWFYGKVTLRSLDGKVEINAPVNPGMVKVGIKDWYVTTHVAQCVWTINGTLRFNGPLRMGHGSYILVAHGAELEFGTKGTYLGTDLKILCFERVHIGDSVRCAWNVQIMDTSFHYIESEKHDMKAAKLTAPIAIGNYVWLGNTCTIGKGAVIPDNTIVASNSLVNKNLSDIKPYTLIAGCPAAPKAEGLHRVWDENKQAEYDKQYGYDRTHL